MKRTVYLILFRGVGGKTQLPTKELREKLIEAGFENVATYINSGNAIVRSRMNRNQVITTIADLCRTQFGFDKAIFAPTAAEWQAVIKNNPFPKMAEGKHVHAALLAEKPDAAAIKALLTLAVGGEDMKVIKNVTYIHTPNGFGTSKFAAKFDKGIGVVNTARNWNTVLKMHELAQGLEGL